MTLDVYSGSLLIGIVQALFLALALAVKRSPVRKANRYLAALLVTFACSLYVHLLSVTGGWQDWLNGFVLLSTATFLIGPLLYFYVRQLCLPDSRWTPVQYLHLLPWAINAVLFVYLLTEQPSLFATRVSADTARSALVLPLLKLLSIVIYTLLSLNLLYFHGRRIRQLYANLERPGLGWLRNLIFGFLALETVFIVLLLSGIDISAVPGEMDTLISGILILMIFMTGYYGLQQPQVFNPELAPGDNDEQTRSPAGTVSTARARLDETSKTQLATRLKSQMENQQLFKNHTLDLRGLADAVKVSPHQLSYYLNHVSGVSFYEYINRHRVHYAKTQLVSSQTPILDIALEAGFSNKATFNSAFKKSEHVTPGQYRKAHQQK